MLNYLDRVLPALADGKHASQRYGSVIIRIEEFLPVGQGMGSIASGQDRCVPSHKKTLGSHIMNNNINRATPEPVTQAF